MCESSTRVLRGACESCSGISCCCSLHEQRRSTIRMTSLNPSLACTPRRTILKLSDVSSWLLLIWRCTRLTWTLCSMISITSLSKRFFRSARTETSTRKRACTQQAFQPCCGQDLLRGTGTRRTSIIALGRALGSKPCVKSVRPPKLCMLLRPFLGERQLGTSLVALATRVLRRSVPPCVADRFQRWAFDCNMAILEPSNDDV